MVTAVSASRPTATQDPSATLREGYMSSLRSTMGNEGRAAMVAISLAQGAPSSAPSDDMAPRRDPVAELQANRHTAQRYQNPSASMPQLQALSEDLREDGDDDDLTAAYDLDESMQDMTQEASQADDLSMLSRVKSQWNAKKEEGMQRIADKAKKEFEKQTRNLQTEGTAKFASAADEGEAFEVADTLGTAVSVGHAGLSIFQDSFDAKTTDVLSKAGFPMLKISNPVDLAIIAGTNMQVLKWSFMVTVLIPFCVIFIVMSAISACYESFACSIGSNILSTISSFLGS